MIAADSGASRERLKKLVIASCGILIKFLGFLYSNLRVKSLHGNKIGMCVGSGVFRGGGHRAMPPPLGKKKGEERKEGGGRKKRQRQHPKYSH
jgi:hypothetical protein